MTVSFKSAGFLETLRLAGKCEAITFIMEDGTTRSGRCRRRSCPICWKAWAFQTATALELRSAFVPYNGIWVHIILTVDDTHAEMFPTVDEFPDCHIKVVFASQAVSEFSRSLRMLHGDRSGSNPPYGRVLEYGEQTGRWHIHYISYINRTLYDSREVDKAGFSHCAISNCWKFGGIRITSLRNGPRGLRYLASYAGKQSYGRFVMDRSTSQLRKFIRLLSNRQTGPKAIGVIPGDKRAISNSNWYKRFLIQLRKEMRNEHLRIPASMPSARLVSALRNAIESADSGSDHNQPGPGQ